MRGLRERVRKAFRRLVLCCGCGFGPSWGSVPRWVEKEDF